jgi:hypothetical protein
MSNDQLESEIQSDIMDAAKALGWFVDKIMRCGRKGFPDLYLARQRNGVKQHKLIEVKRPGEEAEPQQKKRHRELRAAGVEVHVVDNVLDAKRILK